MAGPVSITGGHRWRFEKSPAHNASRRAVRRFARVPVPGNGAETGPDYGRCDRLGLPTLPGPSARQRGGKRGVPKSKDDLIPKLNQNCLESDLTTLHQTFEIIWDSSWCGRRDSNPHDVAIEGF